MLSRYLLQDTIRKSPTAGNVIKEVSLAGESVKAPFYLLCFLLDVHKCLKYCRDVVLVKMKWNNCRWDRRKEASYAHASSLGGGSGWPT